MRSSAGNAAGTGPGGAQPSTAPSAGGVSSVTPGAALEADGVPLLVREGEVLDGKYRVERVLGAGGMGVVVAATHIHLDERVAIKLLLPQAAKSPVVAQRFLQEARAAVKIKSEHVARVTDVGTLSTGTPYMVMEYLAGSDLSDALAATGPLPVEVAVEYVLQACEALAEAHAAGVVHRDLKPANLFLTRRADGSACIKVLDFGISKVASSAGNPRMTKTSTVMGSPLYMSPEQMKSSRDVDARADIWALGVILFELLAGEPPFDGDTIPQLCLRIVQEPTPPLSRFRADVPPGLEAAIHRCQEKSPDQRFRHVGELAEALAPFVTGRARLSAERVAEIMRASGQLGQQGGSALPPVPGGTGVSTSPSWSGTLAPKRRTATTTIVAAVGGAALLVGAALGFVTVRGSGGAPDEAPAPDTPAVEAAAEGPAIAPAGAGAAPVLPPTTEATASAPDPAVTAEAAPAADASAAPSADASAAPAPVRHPGPLPTRRPAGKPPGGGTLFDDRK